MYVYDASGELAAKYVSAAAAAAPCTTCFISTDHLGTTRMVTDQAGNVVARHNHMPFGEELLAGYAGRPLTIAGGASPWNSGDDIRQKFTGKERDTESTLDYFSASSDDFPKTRGGMKIA